jgi:hypothetical protein
MRVMTCDAGDDIQIRAVHPPLSQIGAPDKPESADRKTQPFGLRDRCDTIRTVHLLISDWEGRGDAGGMNAKEATFWFQLVFL